MSAILVIGTLFSGFAFTCKGCDTFSRGIRSVAENCIFDQPFLYVMSIILNNAWGVSSYTNNERLYSIMINMNK